MQAAPERASFDKIPKSVVIGAGLVLVSLVIGIGLVFGFVSGERDRDLAAWQTRLSIVAESRTAAVSGWLARQEQEVQSLADNDALRLYMTAVSLAGTGQSDLDAALAQAGYLRNLLVVEAHRTGFEAPVGPDVGANVGHEGRAGLALVDRNGRVLVATPGMPRIEGALADFLKGLPAAKAGIRDLARDGAGEASMAFAAPVFGLQADPTPEGQIGWILGIKEVAGELYPLLKQPGATETSAEALLVSDGGSVVSYLSPRADGTAPLAASSPRHGADSAGDAALDKPGAFGLFRDYRGRDVLALSRAIPGTSWILLYKVDRAEALADSDQRLSRLLTALLLSVVLAAALILAYWRHGSSLRAARAANSYRLLATRFEQQERLLRLVTDSQPNAIAIIDGEARYRFANRKAAEEAGTRVPDMIGKPVANVWGADAARRYLEIDRASLLRTGHVEATHRIRDRMGAERVVEIHHVLINPTLDLPLSDLVVESDVTGEVMERERRIRILAQLARTLVGVVDRRDPFAADHSLKVARIARAIAEEMDLSPELRQTAEIAGNLMNLGKILVREDVLIRETPLQPDELRAVHRGLEATADLLRGVEFDGPVVETLRQARERVDGAGAPGGLKGDEILITARIVAVANAFTGMVSRRAHRDAIALDKAIETLMDEAGRAFDRAVVSALVSYLDNHGGRAAWAAMEAESPMP